VCRNPGSLRAAACASPFVSAGPGENLVSGSPLCRSALCHAVATSWFFRPLQHYFKLHLFSSCHWWQLPIPHQVRNALWRQGSCAVLMGLVTTVPRFVARKPSAEDDTLVVCPSMIMFLVPTWRPSSGALPHCCVRSPVSSLGRSGQLSPLS